MRNVIKAYKLKVSKRFLENSVYIDVLQTLHTFSHTNYFSSASLSLLVVLLLLPHKKRHDLHVMGFGMCKKASILLSSRNIFPLTHKIGLS